MESSDICIEGCVSVGQSLAHQLAKRSARLPVLDRGQERQSASWGGGGSRLSTVAAEMMAALTLDDQNANDRTPSSRPPRSQFRKKPRIG